MPRFEPFRGLRYAPQVDLDSVVAPPYDVVSPAERAELVDRSAHNCIQIELPLDDPTDGRDRFQVAVDLWRQWQREGVLAPDAEDTFYVCRMTFTDESGASHSTTGVIGALELVPPGDGDVLPHERTTPKPKGERLGLQRACRANLSPVWGLSMGAGLSDALAPGGHPDGRHLGRAVDPEGVVHELWALPAGRAAAVAKVVGAAPVVLADGHHRYETALAYRAEVREAEGNAAGLHDLVMALVVELSGRELSVRAIHRLISGLPDDLDVPAVLGEYFELTPSGPPDDAFLGRMIDSASLGIVTPDGSWLAHPLPSTDAAAEYPLDSALLDVARRALPDHEVAYQHGAGHVTAAVKRGEAQLGVLLRPADVTTIEAMARSRRRMPPKTTFFYPKPRTGLVFRSLA